MKKTAALALASVAVVVFCVSAGAQTYFDEQYRACGADELTENLPEETADLLEEAEISVTGFGDGDGATFGSLADTVGKLFENSSGTPLKACAAIAGITVVCALLSSLKSAADAVPLAEPAAAAGTLAGFAAVMTPIAEHIEECCKDVGGLCDFSAVFMPVFAAVAAADGNPAAAAGCGAYVLALSEGISVVFSKLILPVMRVFLAVSAVSALSPCLRMDGLSEALSGAVKWALGLLAIVFTGVLAAGARTAAAADGAAAKAARFVVSNAVPVIGGAVGDALASVQSCVGVLRGSVGGFGLIAMGFILLPKVIGTVVWLFGISLCRTLAQTFGVDPLEKLLSSVHSALSIMLSIMVFTALTLTASTATLLGGAAA